MAINDILLLGDKRLYQKSEPVTKEELRELNPQIDLMFESILDFRKKYNRGRGIAAPQIGLFKRIVCLQIDSPLVLINPEITAFSKEEFEVWDDCMSFPTLMVKVKRHRNITVEYLDLNWEKQSWEVEGDLAELLQHECDHLNGILAIQRAIDNESFKWRNGE